MRTTDFLILFLGLVAISIADVLAKKIAYGQSNFWTTITNPLMLVIIVLYVVQIMVFIYVFVKKAELGIVGIAQTVIYAIIVIGSGVLFFNENLSLPKVLGAVLAIFGVILMNL